MPPPDDLYMGTRDQADPYGPHNPPPPPAAGPPPPSQHSNNSKHRAESADGSEYSDKPKDERGHKIHQQRERSTKQPERYQSSPYYEAEWPEYRRYRERSPPRSRSLLSPRKAHEVPSYGGKGLRLARHSPLIHRFADADYHLDGRKQPSNTRYRSRSPRRGGRHEQYQYYEGRENHEEKEYKRTRTEYTHSHGQRSLTPVSVREQRIRSTGIPETAYPLRDYTNYISDNHAAKRRDTSRNCHLPTFRNGDGKVNPSAYGSVLQYDFGLCYCTFKTIYMCEMGTRCPWRHHPLSEREKEWIEEIAQDKGRQFIEQVENCWARPDIPVPGHNMIEVMQQERNNRRCG